MDSVDGQVPACFPTAARAQALVLIKTTKEIEMNMATCQSVRLRDVVRLVCLLVSAVISVALMSAEALASPSSSDGLSPGTPVPSWAAGRHIHFLQGPASASTLNPGTSKGAHNQLGRRCESGYCPTPPLLFKGGNGVQHNPKLYLIFWGSNWRTTGSALHTQLLGLFNGLSGSAYQGILTQYYDSSGYISSSVMVAGEYLDDSRPAPSAVNDAAIRAEVAAAIVAKGWPRSVNAQFIVITAPGSTYETGFFSGCAYHGIDSSGSSYTFDPYVGDEPFFQRCKAYDPNQNVNNVTSMLASHEYAESATDPWVNTWLTSDNWEIGDICASGDDVLPNGAYVQGQWDNHQNACYAQRKWVFGGVAAPNRASSCGD